MKSILKTYTLSFQNSKTLLDYVCFLKEGKQIIIKKVIFGRSVLINGFSFSIDSNKFSTLSDFSIIVCKFVTERKIQFN